MACECESPTFDTEAFGNIPALEDVPWLDATAMCDEEGERVLLTIVNRHPSDTFAARIELNGAEGLGATNVKTLHGKSERTTTSEDLPQAVGVTVEALDSSAPLTRSFPAHSATIFSFEAEN